METLTQERSERSGGSVVRQIAVPVVFVAAAALVGWLLLLFVKSIVVLITYALGAALVVVPLVMARWLLKGHSGGDRWRRIGTVAAAVLLGVALIAVAHLLARHGWLLIAIPAAFIAIDRIVDRVGKRREVA